jgi:hypothetical protein
MGWNTKMIDFGSVQTDSKNTAEFLYNGVEKIKSVKTGCSCSVATFTPNKISVVYRAPKFPKHLSSMGMSEAVDSKTVKVTMDNGDTHILTIKARLKK